MHGIGNVLAPCGGVNDTDDNDFKRGDDETGWLVNGILGSRGWERGRNALFIVFDEGNGPLTCANYNPDTGTDTVHGTLLPGPDCYDLVNFNDNCRVIAWHLICGRIVSPLTPRHADCFPHFIQKTDHSVKLQFRERLSL